jgi:transcriptional regulator with XRE-family HTH domain
MNKTHPQNLGNNLANLLKIHKLSIDKLANLLNIPSMTVRRLVSGETIDPRISTLQLIANYFNVSLDALMSNSEQALLTANEFNQFNVPVISWDIVEKFTKFEINAEAITRRQLITLHKDEILENKSLFAIESKPSMYLIYPQGTIFIIAPAVKPIDGDLVLVKFIKEDAMSLKKLQIDPPESYLHQITQLTSNNDAIKYSNKNHSIFGVVILTLLYNHNKAE